MEYKISTACQEDCLPKKLNTLCYSVKCEIHMTELSETDL